MSTADILSLLNGIAARLGVIESKIGAGGGGAAPVEEGELPRAVKGYDAYYTESFVPFKEACDKLGGDAAKIGELMKSIFDEQRAYIFRAAECKEPAQAALPQLFGPIAMKCQELGKNVARNEWEKHWKTAAEGVGAVNWLCVKPAPRDFVENYIGGSDYWANGIRKEYRATNPDQVAFCNTFKALLTNLMAYIKEYHTTGVSWNPRGKDVSEYSVGAAVPAATATAPAPAATVPAPASSASTAPAANPLAGLKADAATAGLKKVTKDQQTWRSEYKGGDAPAPKAVVPKAAPKPNAANQVKGPPKCEFQVGGARWCVENQSGPCEVTVKEIKETVYVYGCIGATIKINGKCKSVIVDTCKRTTVEFDNAFASCEVVNCQRMNVKCLEKVASVAIDKTDGIVVHLPTTSLDSKIVASKSSEMNLTWPDASGDWIERPIPEQYVHNINPAKDGVTADVSDLYS